MAIPDCIVSQFSDANYDKPSWEGQIRGDRADGTLNWVIGGFYRNTHVTAPSTLVPLVLPYSHLAGPRAGYRWVTPGRSLTIIAIYGQGSWEFVDNLTLTAGYRWTQIDLLTDTHNFVPKWQMLRNIPDHAWGA